MAVYKKDSILGPIVFQIQIDLHQSIVRYRNIETTVNISILNDDFGYSAFSFTILKALHTLLTQKACVLFNI